MGRLITRCYNLGWLRRLGHVDEEELLDEGYILEANRQFFHPLGLELVAQVADDGLRLRVMDRREMPAGLVFEREEDEKVSGARRRKIARVACLWETRAQARLDRYGFIVQPREQLV